MSFPRGLQVFKLQLGRPLSLTLYIVLGPPRLVCGAGDWKLDGCLVPYLPSNHFADFVFQDVPGNVCVWVFQSRHFTPYNIMFLGSQIVALCQLRSSEAWPHYKGIEVLLAAMSEFVASKLHSKLDLNSHSAMRMTDDSPSSKISSPSYRRLLEAESSAMSGWDVSRLKHEMEDAAAREDYTMAARLRDLIKQKNEQEGDALQQAPEGSGGRQAQEGGQGLLGRQGEDCSLRR